MRNGPPGTGDDPVAPGTDESGSAPTGLGGRPGEAAEASGRRIAGAGAVQIIFRAAGILVSGVTVVVLARSLGTDEYGAWTAALAFTGLFAFTTDLGLVNVAIQRMADDPDHEDEWLGALVALRGIAAIVAVGLCLLALPILSDTAEVRSVAAILAATILLAVPAGLLAVFQARLRGGLQMALLTAQGVTWLGVVAVLAAEGSDVTTFALGLVAVSALFAAIQVLTVRRYARVSLRAGRRRWRPLFAVSAPMAIGGLLVAGYYRIDAIFVLNIAGAAEAGVYGVAYRLLDTVHFLPAAVMIAVLPAISAIRDTDPARVRRLVDAATRYIAVIGLGAFAGALALAEPFIATFFGDDFRRSADVLPILMLAFVCISQGYIAGWLVPVLGLQWFYAGCAAGGLALNVALNLVLVPSYGALGAAWATLSTELVVNALTLTAVFRSLEFVPRISPLLRVASAAAVLGLSARAGAEISLAGGVVAGALVYPAALFAFRALERDDLRVFKRSRT